MVLKDCIDSAVRISRETLFLLCSCFFWLVSHKLKENCKPLETVIKPFILFVQSIKLFIYFYLNISVIFIWNFLDGNKFYELAERPRGFIIKR